MSSNSTESLSDEFVSQKSASEPSSEIDSELDDWLLSSSSAAAAAAAAATAAAANLEILIQCCRFFLYDLTSTIFPTPSF